MAFTISFRGIVEPILAGKLDNKVPNGLIRFPKEGSNTSMPEFRRSRSSPRGKFLILPWGFHSIQHWILLPLISFPSKFCTVTTISVQVPNCLLLLWGFWWCFGGDYGGASLLLINILRIYLCNSNQISFIFSGCNTCVLCVSEAAFDTISIM